MLNSHLRRKIILKFEYPITISHDFQGQIIKLIYISNGQDKIEYTIFHTLANFVDTHC